MDEANQMNQSTRSAFLQETGTRRTQGNIASDLRPQRPLGDVILPDGTNVNHTLLKEGWWYRTWEWPKR